MRRRRELWRGRRAWPALVLVALLGTLLPTAGRAQAAPACRFQGGFATLQALLPAQVGACREDEQHDPVTGNARQRTTGGLLVWTKLTNRAAFTDGYHTWLLSGGGLQERLNAERFPWEASWPTYLHDPERTADAATANLSPVAATTLLPRWTFATGGPVAASPDVMGDTVYVGSWDGYEYALDAATGALRWKTFLGLTHGGPDCDPAVAGITSTATVQGDTLYVGGGDGDFYALDAASGAVRWRVRVGDNSPGGGAYNWSSPLLYHGFAYVGVASLCDNPLVQGRLWQVDQRRQQIVRSFDVVPDGQTGGSIWTSPTVDPATNTIFITSGNRNGPVQPYVESVIALDATTLAVRDHWQHSGPTVPDPDWGTTPTLFADASGRPLLAAGHKDGKFYAFDRAHLGAGPIWTRNIAEGGPCPDCGDGTASSAAFGGGRLYVGGGRTTVGGVAAKGAVRALDPATGRVLWERATAGPVLPALAYAGGLVVAGAGPELEVLDAASGTPLYRYATGGTIEGPPAIAGDAIFVGSADHHVYAFGPPAT